MRYRSYDIDEVLAYAAQGLSAAQIIEELGLSVGERTIQRIVVAHFGHRPTYKSIERDDPIRSAVVKAMIAQGCDPHQCSRCGRSTLMPLAIHATCREPEVKDLVFVCVTRCATVADQ